MTILDLKILWNRFCQILSLSNPFTVKRLKSSLQATDWSNSKSIEIMRRHFSDNK